MTDNSTISNGSDYSDEGEEGEEENEEGLGEVDENGNPVVTTKITTYDAREGTDIILAQEANDILESSELINSLAGKYTMRGRKECMRMQWKKALVVLIFFDYLPSLFQPF